jgi:DNA-binding NtrC family response regulator
MNARPVLLIDADTDWCAHVCRFLETHGIPVMTASNLETATLAVEHIGKPGAVVMDTTSRSSNGRAVSAFRNTPLLQDVPVGYLKKYAALDALLLMLCSPTDSNVPGLKSANVRGFQAALTQL